LSKWKIEFDEKAKVQLLNLDKQTQKRIVNFLDKRILARSNPRLVGSALRGKLSDCWKYRIGDYRLICKLEDSILLVLVIAVGHRREVYKKK
jgi:mRNA interferase RelE/StbE